MKGVINVKNRGKELEFNTKQKVILVGAVACSTIVGFAIGKKYTMTMLNIGLTAMSLKNPELMPMLVETLKEFN